MLAATELARQQTGRAMEQRAEISLEQLPPIAMNQGIKGFQS
jgi:hypothetical protein